MKNTLLSVLAVLALCACTTEKEKLQTRIPSLLSEAPFSGIVHIENEGEVLFRQTIAGTEAGLPAPDADSRVCLASLTKLFTELTVLRLSDQGRIDLDANIQTYRPNFRPAFGEVVTIRHLLEMKSGLPRELSEHDLFSGVSFDEQGMAGPFLDTIPDFELAFDPGSQEAYSNLNYWLLGAVIEAVTETGLQAAYSKQLFDVLNMNNSGLVDTDTKLLAGYRKESDRWVEDQTNLRVRYASGGAYSTLDDLLLLAAALQAEDFLSAASRDVLLGPDGTVEVYGSLPAFTNVFISEPATGFTLIALNNIGLPDLDLMTRLQAEARQVLSIAPAGGSSRKVQLQPISELRDSVPLEAGMKAWVAAIEAGDEERIFRVLDAHSLPGSNDRNDPSWQEIIRLRNELPNFRAAGFRWVENGQPGGLESWFVNDGEGKIAFLWIPDEEDPEKVAFLMVKPDDLEWMGEDY